MAWDTELLTKLKTEASLRQKQRLRASSQSGSEGMPAAQARIGSILRSERNLHRGARMLRFHELQQNQSPLDAAMKTEQRTQSLPCGCGKALSK